MIDQKTQLVGLPPGELRIDVDPQSRMFDPNNPDCQPRPPDDPTSNLFLQCVDCKKGEKCWQHLPQTPFVENPSWHDQLPFDENGEIVLDLQGAVQLALRESPNFQSQLEELYLSALDVTFERFRFDCQFFGGSGIQFTSDGEVRSGTGAPSSELVVSPLSPNSALRFNRLTATGGELTAGLANSLVWQFAGPDNFSSNTLLDFSLFQPLLRASGRGVILERLTIAERSLLANVRQMERFRRNFYFSVFSGANPGQGPSRRGGFFGGSGLEGFSGIGGGGFGRVGNDGGNFNNNNGGFGNTGGAGAQGAGGYLGLLQSIQVLRNQRSNVSALRDSVIQLEASNDAGRIDRFQVDLARQALFNAQSQLLTSENQFRSSFENFKVSIGLPPELPIRVRDPSLDRLNLLDPGLDRVQQRVAAMLYQLKQMRADREELAGAQRGEELILPNLQESTEEIVDTPSAEQLDDYLASNAEIVQAVRTLLDRVKADYATLESTLPARKKSLAQLADRPELDDADIDRALFDPAILSQRIDKQRTELQSLEQQLTKSCALLESIQVEREFNTDELLDQAINGLSSLSGQLLELSLAQASARLESISFKPVELTEAQALAIASNYRRDWMNARANLVDAWRLIYFNANNLQSDLDLVFSGDIGNVGDNPFRFRSTNGRLRVGLEFDAPLTRLSERNVYRQSLIEYQQARRNYYQFRDGVYQGLRNTLRQIRLNEINFELRRAAVQVAISQVDLTQLRLSEPPKPGETTQFGNSTARDLVQALSDLLNVQNDFLSVWVNHEVQRLNLEVNLGVMELTAGGLRVENDIPLETYVAGLPIHSADLGPIVTEQLQRDAIELLHPETVVPDSKSQEPDQPDIELLPLPAGSATRESRDIRLISAQLPIETKPSENPTQNLLPLPPVEDPSEVEETSKLLPVARPVHQGRASGA